VRALALLVASVLALLETGCPLLDNNNGSDAACDGGGPTLVQQCSSVYAEYCNQAATRCAISVPSDCAAQATMAHCPCAVESCDASSCETIGSITACKQDLDTEDCNAIINAFMGGWPSDCQPFMGQAQ
jgi:hypothetical protein